jgi:hypothetical protein
MHCADERIDGRRKEIIPHAKRISGDHFNEKNEGAFTVFAALGAAG